MNIAYFGSSSNFISCLMMRELKHRLGDDKLVHVFDTAPSNTDTKLMSQGYLQSLARYVVIRMFGKQKVSWRWFGKLGGARVKDINGNKFIRRLKLDDIDAILSVGCVQKFGKRLIESFRCANYHNSILPKYRGLNSMSWQVYLKDENVGYTWHRITEDWDSGNVLVQGILPNNYDIRRFDDVLELEVQKTLLASIDLPLVLSYLRDNVQGGLQEGKSSYYGRKELDALKRDEWARTCFGWMIAPEEFVPKWILNITR